MSERRTTLVVLVDVTGPRTPDVDRAIARWVSEQRWRALLGVEGVEVGEIRAAWVEREVDDG